jgi:hypothetical protein
MMRGKVEVEANETIKLNKSINTMVELLDRFNFLLGDFECLEAEIVERNSRLGDKFQEGNFKRLKSKHSQLKYS